MRTSTRIKRAFRDMNFLLDAIIFCVLCQVADVVSSLSAAPAGSSLMEQNPFARHANGHFWLSHALVDKVFYLCGITIVALIIYYSVKPIHKKVAQLAATLPYLWLGIICLMAAMNNVLLVSGLGRF